MIDVPDRPQLPLTNTRKALLAVGAAMFATHVSAALLFAPEITGEGDANAGAILALWAGSIPWCAAVALLIVRQANLPDIATASMLATIAPFALFTLSAALDARGTTAEYDVVSATFLGVTAGALTAMIVWALAMAIARLLKLPTTSATSS
jgi:hypothetical protein